LEESSLIANADRTVVLFPYCQPEKERMIIHMVNYDYDAQVDEVNPKEDIQIQIKRPRWLGGRLEVFLVSPDFKERISLQFDIENGYIGLSISKLNIYDVIVIESKSKSFGDS